MANLQNDYPDDQLAALDSKSTPKERKAANDAHHKTLIQHTPASSDYNGHGHSQGKQGRAGHPMVESDGGKQMGANLPQGSCGDEVDNPND